MKKLLGSAVALLALAGAGAASATGVRLVVAPATVAPGGVVTVVARSSPCPSRDRVTLISKAFRGRAFGGEGAVSGPVRRRGSFAVRARIRRALAAGRYEISARCGGGVLPSSAVLRVR